MTFKRARTKEQFAERKERIVEIALKLYDESGYAAVSFSTISNLTSFTRPAIYSYFKSPDDVLLYALGREFSQINEVLARRLDEFSALTADEFAKLLHESFVAHPRLLKMLSINYSIIENGCTDEDLAAFKSVIMQTFSLIGSYVEKFFENVTEEKKTDFEFMVMTYMASVYTLTHPSAKQTVAIKVNNDSFKVPEFEHLCLEGLKAFTRSLC